jgi:hypothetical protein
MGDLNARVGKSKITKCVGKYGEHVYNRNGGKLMVFVFCNHLKIMDT